MARPGLWIPALIRWGVCGMLGCAFSEINVSAAEQRRCVFRPILAGVLAVIGAGIVMSQTLAGWWRG